jgi:hypothetical protein
MSDGSPRPNAGALLRQSQTVRAYRSASRPPAEVWGSISSKVAEVKSCTSLYARTQICLAGSRPLYGLGAGAGFDGLGLAPSAARGLAVDGDLHDLAGARGPAEAVDRDI